MAAKNVDNELQFCENVRQRTPVDWKHGVTILPACAHERLKTIVVYIHTSAGVALEVEAHPHDPVALIKSRVCELGGPPTDEQRLVWRGGILSNDSTLSECGVWHGAMLRLVPLVAEGRTVHVEGAQRGLLMFPSSKPWTPRVARRKLPAIQKPPNIFNGHRMAASSSC